MSTSYKISMEANKCVNCGGQLKMSESRTRWICPFCDSIFEITQGASGAQATSCEEGAGLNPEFFVFETDYRDAAELSHTGESIRTIAYSMSELGTTDEIEAYIRKHLLDDTDVAAEGINQHLIDSVRSRINAEIEAGERIIFYGDNGVFSKGKDFFVVTNKRSLFMTKKRSKSVLHEEVDFIVLDEGGDIPCFRLNGDIDKNISCVGNKYKLQGCLVALIVLFAFKANPNRKKIRMS